MSDIVRILPKRIPIPTWIQYGPTIPKSNVAMSLCFSSQFRTALERYRRIPIDIYYNETKNIVAPVKYSDDYTRIPRGAFEHVLKIYAEYEAYVQSVEKENERLHDLSKACMNLVFPTEFVWFNGVKYGNKLENCRIQMAEYHAIERNLPKFHAVSEPSTERYDVIEINIVTEENRRVEHTVNNKYITHWIHLIQNYMRDHEVPDNIDKMYTIRLEKCDAKCDSCKKRFKRTEDEIYLVMSGKIMHQICNDYKNKIYIEANEDIIELYNRVYKLTEPAHYIVYDGVKYGHPDLVLDI